MLQPRRGRWVALLFAQSYKFEAVAPPSFAPVKATPWTMLQRAATEVVLSGCSAGGLAVYLQADYVASFLPKATRLVAVPDSGYFSAKGSFEGSMRNAATRFFDMDTNAACHAAATTKEGTEVSTTPSTSNNRAEYRRSP